MAARVVLDTAKCSPRAAQPARQDTIGRTLRGRVDNCLGYRALAPTVRQERTRCSTSTRPTKSEGSSATRQLVEVEFIKGSKNGGSLGTNRFTFATETTVARDLHE